MARMSLDSFEKKPRIAVRRIAAAWQASSEGVDGPAAVGVDEPTNELSRRTVQQDSLPRSQFNLALVLPAGAVVGEYVLPVAVRRTKAHAAVLRIAPDAHDHPGYESLERFDAFIDDPR
jgi:hypothetical protein